MIRFYRAPTDGIAAVKLTGLGKPQMLLRISKILLGVRKIWIAAFTQGGLNLFAPASTVRMHV